MAHALVTGAAGFIGSHLSRELLDRGYRVRGLDDLSHGNRRTADRLRADDGFEFVEADVAVADLSEAVSGASTVFHLAAMGSVTDCVEDPVRATEVNCIGTARLLAAAAAAGVDRFVFASTSHVYAGVEAEVLSESAPTPGGPPYSLTKQYGEGLVEFFGDRGSPSTVTLRPFNTYGPGQDVDGSYDNVVPKFFDLLADGVAPTVYGDGTQVRDFVFVDDVVAAFVAAAESDLSGETINVARGEGASVLELVDLMNDVLGTDVAPVHREGRPVDAPRLVGDPRKARERLDFYPETDLPTGLRRTAERMGLV